MNQKSIKTENQYYLENKKIISSIYIKTENQYNLENKKFIGSTQSFLNLLPYLKLFSIRNRRQHNSDMNISVLQLHFHSARILCRTGSSFGTTDSYTCFNTELMKSSLSALKGPKGDTILPKEGSEFWKGGTQFWKARPCIYTGLILFINLGDKGWTCSTNCFVSSI